MFRLARLALEDSKLLYYMLECELPFTPKVSLRNAGQVLRDLVFAKYGKQYDLSIVRRQIAGVTIVALNVMWTHLDQRSFPMSEPEFMEKLDTIAEYLRQAQLLLAFLQSLRSSSQV